MSDFALVPSDLGCSFCKWMADIGRTCECALKPCHQFVRILPARATVWVVDRRSTQKLPTRSQLEFPLLACKRKSEPVGVRSRSWQPWSWPNLLHLISYSCFKDPRKPLIWVMHCEPIQCAMTNVSTPCCTWSWASSTGLGSNMVTAWDSGCSDSSGTEWPAASWCWLLQLHVLPGVFPRHFRSISVTLVFKVHLPQAAGSN